MAAWIGTVPSALLGGVGVILVSLLWLRLFPALRRVERLTGEAPDEGRKA